MIYVIHPKIVDDELAPGFVFVQFEGRQKKAVESYLNDVDKDLRGIGGDASHQVLVIRGKRLPVARKLELKVGDAKPQTATGG